MLLYFVVWFDMFAVLLFAVLLSWLIVGRFICVYWFGGLVSALRFESDVV